MSRSTPDRQAERGTRRPTLAFGVAALSWVGGVLFVVTSFVADQLVFPDGGAMHERVDFDRMWADGFLLCAAVTFLLDLTAIVLGLTTHRRPVLDEGCRYWNRMAIAMGFVGLLGSGLLAFMGVAFALPYA